MISDWKTVFGKTYSRTQCLIQANCAPLIQRFHETRKGPWSCNRRVSLNIGISRTRGYENL